MNENRRGFAKQMQKSEFVTIKILASDFNAILVYLLEH